MKCLIYRKKFVRNYGCSCVIILSMWEAKKMKRRRDYYLFRAIRAIVHLFYPAVEIENIENLPKMDAVVVANHCQMNGPICSELFLPKNCYTWCAGQMMNLKEVPDYAYEDFWSGKSEILRPFYKILSYIIAPISVCVFNNARTIGVYHDMRSLSTFKSSVRMLDEGKNIVIFPEKNEAFNNIVFMFQEKFVDIARLYYKKYNKELSFVPMYIAPKLKKMYVGKPVRFDNTNDIKSERNRICTYLMDEITSMAVNLPEHTVIPYPNISKNRYLTNKNVNEVPR